MESFCRAPVAPMGTRKLREELAEPREPVLRLVERPLGGLANELELWGPQLGMEGKEPNSPALRPAVFAFENWSPSLLDLNLDAEEEEEAFLDSLRRSLRDLLCVLGVPMPRDAGTWDLLVGWLLGPVVSSRSTSDWRRIACCMLVLLKELASDMEVGSTPQVGVELDRNPGVCSVRLSARTKMCGEGCARTPKRGSDKARAAGASGSGSGSRQKESFRRTSGCKKWNGARMLLLASERSSRGPIEQSVAMGTRLDQSRVE